MRDEKEMIIKVKRILFSDKYWRRAIVCYGINMSHETWVNFIFLFIFF